MLNVTTGKQSGGTWLFSGCEWPSANHELTRPLIGHGFDFFVLLLSLHTLSSFRSPRVGWGGGGGELV